MHTKVAKLASYVGKFTHGSGSIFIEDILLYSIELHIVLFDDLIVPVDYALEEIVEESLEAGIDIFLSSCDIFDDPCGKSLIVNEDYALLVESESEVVFGTGYILAVGN